MKITLAQRVQTRTLTLPMPTYRGMNKNRPPANNYHFLFRGRYFVVDGVAKRPEDGDRRKIEGEILRKFPKLFARTSVELNSATDAV